MPSSASRDLLIRGASVLILAPVTLAAVIFGTPWFDLLVVLAVLLLAREYLRVCTKGRKSAAGLTLLAGTALSVLVGAILGHYALGVIASLAFGAVVVLLVRPPARRLVRVVAGFGVPYIVIPALALLWLRKEPSAGFLTIVWLLAVTWATDTGAYFAGRRFGGPKLAPRISPSKTWSGFFGGLAAAGLIGWLGAVLVDGAMPAWSAALGVVLGAGAAGGDLLESAGKRFFGIKDSGTLIPGHGGALDRLDSLLMTASLTWLAGVAGWHLT